MKTLFSQSSINRFPLFLLSVVILLTGAVFIWFIWHLSGYDDMQSFAAHQHSAGLVITVISILAIVMAAWLVTVRIFYKSQKTFLIKNAAMKRTEEALQQSEAHIRELFENANDLVYTTDFQGYFTSLNKAGEGITGYTKDEFCKMNFTEIVVPEHHKLARRMPAIKPESDVPTAYEIEIITKTGSRVALDISCRLIYEAGEPIGVQGIGRDDTARKRAEETLRESEARYRVVTESASDAILTIDQEQTILFVNPAAEKIFGYALDEMLGNKLVMLMPEHLRGAHAAGMKRYNETNKRNIPWQGVELPALHKDGHEVPIEVTFGEINSNGKHLFTAVIRDITERKHIKEELQKNLSLLTSTFEATADGILVVDRNNTIVTYNQRFIEMWQIPDEIINSRDNAQIINCVLEQLSNADDFAATTKYLTANPEGKHFDLLEFKDGKIYERYSHPQMLDGKVVGRVINCRDITERKRTEDTLRESESILAAAPRITHLGSWELELADLENLNNNGVRWSDETYRIFGFEPGQIEVSNEVFYNAVHPDDRTRIGKVLIEAIEQRKVYKVEHRIILPDGSERLLYGQAELTFDEQTGKPVKLLGTVQDITERKLAEEALRESEARYRLLFDRNPQPVLVFDSETLQFLAVNEEAVRHYGYSHEEFLELTVKNICPPEDVPQILKFLARTISDNEITNTGQHRKKDGTIIEVEIAAQSINFANRPARFVLVTDITERKRANDALRESENKFRMLVENTSEGLLQVDTDDRTQFINNRLCEMVGYSADELINKNWTQILLDDEGRDLIGQANERRRKGISDRYEIKLRKKSGELLWVIIGGAPTINAEGVIIGSLGVFSDITERKRAEEQLLHDAFHDGLTGLANRALFMDHLRMTIERSKSRHSNSYAVLFLDFDRFKVINDSLGHAEGDNLLTYIARRLESSTRTGDLVARLGGDEFVILLSEMLEEGDAVQVAERIQTNLKNPFDLSGSEVFVSASIGIALSTAGHKRAEDMLRDADIAMYRAKAKGRAQYQVFDQAMHDYASKQLSLETEMRRALERREFLIHYQPIINLENESLVGFEALVRWEHPTRGMIPPFEFIPAAEENGLILPLGKWILRESCRQMHHWQKENPSASHLKVSVNLSTKQFSQTDLAEQIAAALRATNLDPHCLKLEITESHVMENSEQAIVVMNRLRSLGVELSLDDFGTGYSSLSYLHRLPVSYLKIDRSFVMRMTENEENGEIVSTIIKLAQNLKMKVVAEGIETAEQLAHLKSLDCEYGQGYFFSKPLEAEAAGKFIEEKAGNFPFAVNQDFGIELNM